MKIKNLKVASIALAGTLLTSSCVGSFGLFNTLANWNKKATNSKFLNELIFIVISPAYAFCTTVDALVLNSIEFWTGDNPLAANIGKTKTIIGEDGRSYAVTTLKNGYDVKTPDGKNILLSYDKTTKTWSQTMDGKKVDMIHFNEDGTIKAYLPQGGSIDVTQDQAGLFQLRMAVNDGTYFAFNK